MGDLLSPMHLLLLFLIILLLFGGRKIPEAMRGLGEGIRSFKEGMSGSQAATQPAAPIGLTAKSGPGQVTLSWNASAAASSYNIKRSGASGGPYAQVASTASSSFTDGELASGSKYFYVISSFNAAGESANSAEVSGTAS